ncbi:hypothetical protein F511_24466 [Dorcoceras hygrometricum]|uniref:Uncharacterized protein n=1 Tax=Dorcoceras hygrometricum TaxID=472368 RepID=A0A2Z7C533_9LAMI|nr:hypothetical protein F511_24466 [Dorcoceras hygrometricum]
MLTHGPNSLTLMNTVDHKRVPPDLTGNIISGGDRYNLDFDEHKTCYYVSNDLTEARRLSNEPDEVTVAEQIRRELQDVEEMSKLEQ